MNSAKFHVKKNHSKQKAKKKIQIITKFGVEAISRKFIRNQTPSKVIRCELEVEH
jgi:hypothetical protein